MRGGLPLALSAATRRLLGHRFRLRSLGPQSVKGLAEPVEAFVVEGVSVAESRFGILIDRHDDRLDVGVLVALAVTQAFHQSGGSISDM